jgi:O-antigen ligase
MAENSKTRDLTNASEWFDAAYIEPKSSRASGVVFVLLCAVLIFAPLAYGAVDAWALSLLTLLLFVVALAWLFDARQTGEFRFSASFLQIPLVGLILIGLVQLLPLASPAIAPDLLNVPASRALSLDPYATRFAVVQLALYLIFFAAALVFVENQKRLRRIVFIIVLYGAILAFLGILQRLMSAESIFGVRVVQNAVPFATFINQHHFAAFMEMTAGLTLGLLYNRSTKNDKRLLLWIALAIMGIALILTGSRGGLISFLGVVGFVTLASLILKKEETSEMPQSFFASHFGLIGGALALLFVIFGVVLFLGGDNSLLRGVGLSNAEDVSNGRFHFWSIAAQIIRDHPILGAGLDAFGAAFPRYDTWSGALRVEQAHNDYLQIFADAGIFGFLLALAFVYFLFRESLKRIRRTSDRFRRGTAIGALAGCFGVLIHSFFDFPLRTPSNMFYFLTFAALATVAIKYPKLYKT